MKTHTHKTWLSPFVGVAFAVVSITGALLFFHVKNGPVMVLHEWFGWLFIATGLVHVALNLRPLLGYLRRTSALVALGAAGVIVAALWVAGANHDDGPGRRHHGPRAESSSSATP